MSSSESTNLTAQQINNDTARNNVVKNITNSLERQKDTILKNEGIETEEEAGKVIMSARAHWFDEDENTEE